MIDSRDDGKEVCMHQHHPSSISEGARDGVGGQRQPACMHAYIHSPVLKFEILALLADNLLTPGPALTVLVLS